MKVGFQKTLRDRVTVSGVGVHSAAPAQLVLHPADVDSGIVFLRTGLPGGRERLLEAKRSNVTHTALCTMLGDASGASVGTVEHLLAALSGLQVDNVLIEIDGPETPIMDGSAAAFVSAIDQAGIVQQSRPRRYLKILKPVRVERDGGYAEFLPGGPRLPPRCRDRFRIAGDRPSALRVQSRPGHLPPRNRSRAAPSASSRDVKKLWEAGFALGSSLENSVAIDGRRRHQSGRPALCGRVRAPQGARCDRRPLARRRADRRALPDLSSRPQAERPGVGGAVCRAVRLTRSWKRAAPKALLKGFAAGSHVPAAPPLLPRPD